MKKVPLLGWLIFGCATVNCIAGYGKQWDFSGRYGMPTSLLSPDGKTYCDGSPVDGVTLALVNGGIEQEAWLLGAGVLLVLFTALAFQMRRLYRMHMNAFDGEFRRIDEMPRDDERRN